MSTSVERNAVCSAPCANRGEFPETIAQLAGEHVDLDEALSDLGLVDPDLGTRVVALLAELSLHIDKENLGIFPVPVVALNADGWETVARADEPAATHR